jgi:hypothetical protein
LVLGAWGLGLRAWGLELGAWDLWLGAWRLGLEAWSLRIGACNLKPEDQCFGVEVEGLFIEALDGAWGSKNGFGF